MLSHADAERVAAEDIRAALDEDLDLRASGRIEGAEGSWALGSEAHDELCSGRYGHARQWMNARGLAGRFAEGSDRQRVEFALARLLPEMYRTLVRRAEGDFTPPPVPLAAPDAVAATVQSGKSLTALHAQWKSEVKPRERTADQYLATLGKFHAATDTDPSMDVSGISKRTMMQWREWLAASDLAPKTQSDKWSHLTTLLNFAVDSGYLDASPANGLRISAKDGRDGTEIVKIWEPEHLRTWFLSGWYIGVRGDRLPLRAYPAAMLLIALTGSRPEEIVGLDTADVAHDGAGWLLHIRKNEHRPLKNGASIRTVPLPPVAGRVGLDDFLSRRKTHAGQLFAEILGGNKYGRLWNSVGNWQRRERRKLGLPEHCIPRHLRDTYIALLRRHTDSEDIERALTGHVGRDVHARTYGGPMPVERMRREVAKLEFPFLEP